MNALTQLLSGMEGPADLGRELCPWLNEEVGKGSSSGLAAIPSLRMEPVWRKPPP